MRFELPQDQNFSPLEYCDMGPRAGQYRKTYTYLRIYGTAEELSGFDLQGGWVMSDDGKTLTKLEG